MAERKSAGRPTEYNEKYHVPWIKGLARRGLTVEEIAEEIGVARSTVYKWVSEHQELSDALNSGRSLADIRIEDSLYQRALGVTVEETKTIVASGKGEEGQKPTRIEVTKKEIPPDTTAAIYWLKNRRPDLWRDSYVHTVNRIESDVRDVVDKLIEEIENEDSEIDTEVTTTETV